MTKKKETVNGFIQIPNWLLRGPGELPPYEFAVYSCLLTYADRHGYAFPSLKTIAKGTQISKSSVQRTILALKKRGVLKIESTKSDRGDWAHNRYKLAKYSMEEPKGRETAKGYGHTDHTVWSHRPDPMVTERPDEEPLDKEPFDEKHKVAFQETRRAFSFSNDSVTKKQIQYLSDLHLHRFNEIPDDADKAHWSRLTSGAADALIHSYNQAIPRHYEYAGPREGDPGWGALSEAGKRASDAEMIPDGTWR